MSPNSSANTSTNTSSQVGDILTNLHPGKANAQTSRRIGVAGAGAGADADGDSGLTQSDRGGGGAGGHGLEDSFMVGIGDDTDGISAEGGLDAYNRSQLTSVMSIGSHTHASTGTGTGSGSTQSTGNTLDQRASDGSNATVDEDDHYDGFRPMSTSHYPGDASHQHRQNKMRSDSRGRTESNQSNETISLGTDIGSNEGEYRLNSSASSQLGFGAATPKRSTSSKRKLKRSLIKSTRDRILHMLVNNETIAQTLKYNGRAIIFVIIFCLTTLYIIPLLADLQYFKYQYYQDGTADFISCLMATSAQSQTVDPPIPQNVVDVSNYVNDICGDIPSVRPALGLIISAICWYAAYGIIPALVFGAGSYMVECCCINESSLSVNPDSLPQSPSRMRTRTRTESDPRQQSYTSKR